MLGKPEDKKTALEHENQIASPEGARDGTGARNDGAALIDAADGAARAEAEIPYEEALRADFYDFLSSVLAAAPTQERLDAMARLQAGDDEIGRAAGALARVAQDFDPQRAAREYHDLFIGLGRGELLPYASYYMTGFLHEKPLARLRADMERLRMKRAEGKFEPEDGIASLTSMMAGLIRGRFGPPAAVSVQRDFFRTHIGPWGEHFFSDLERAQHSVLYAPIGAMGRAMMRIEREAFRLEADDPVA